MEKSRLSRAHCPAPAPASPAAAQRPCTGSTGTLSRRTTGALIALGLTTSLLGCGMFAPPPPPPPPPPKPPPKLSIAIVASARLNPDLKGRSSPVVVRMYELKSANQFSSADFMTLFDQDKTVLANDIVTRDEFVMRPGETKAINKLLTPETQAIGVMVAFRDLNRAKWRALATLTPGKDNTVSVEFEDVSVKTTQNAQ